MLTHLASAHQKGTESILEVGGPLGQILLTPQGRVILRMMADREGLYFVSSKPRTGGTSSQSQGFAFNREGVSLWAEKSACKSELGSNSKVYLPYHENITFPTISLRRIYSILKAKQHAYENSATVNFHISHYKFKLDYKFKKIILSEEFYFLGYNAVQSTES